MARLLFCTIAQRAVIDQATQLLDLQAILEQLDLPEPKPEVLDKALREKKAIGVLFPCVLFTYWERDDPSKPESQFEMRVELMGPDKQKLMTTSQQILLSDFVRIRGLIRLKTLPVVGAGRYTFTVSLRRNDKWKKMGETAYSVVFKPEATALQIAT